MENTTNVQEIYTIIKTQIISRLSEFRLIGTKGSDDDIYAELIFCIFTPQSNAVICWNTVKKLREKNLLYSINKDLLINELKGVRFRNNKAGYVIKARNDFFDSANNFTLKNTIDEISDIISKREWLVKNVKGYGYKESSHFLRNIGYGDNIAILDRHILKNLLNNKVITEIPKSLTRKKYMEIENKMITYSKKINIPIQHLDLVFWYSAKKEIFK